uniref:Sodium/potassium-transporting ATPase subunit beta-1-interacting protein n=1 Tax=Timema cristinae TaxID=61476 RepID=A0A7R9H1P9_TIMCR|nr:unnamed protein product [Timema cristinae]
MIAARTVPSRLVDAVCACVNCISNSCNVGSVSWRLTVDADMRINNEKGNILEVIYLQLHGWRVENYLRKSTLITPDQDPNPTLPVVVSPVYCEIDVTEHLAAQAPKFVYTSDELSTIERQVFDFLGYMWAPILANFFNIIFVIFGFYGAFQFRPKYIITDSDVLNLGTGSVSWWEVNGAGCRPIYPTNLTVDDPYPFRPLRPDKVMDCVLDYKYVETFHAALQCLLAPLWRYASARMLSGWESLGKGGLSAWTDLPQKPLQAAFIRRIALIQQNLYRVKALSLTAEGTDVMSYRSSVTGCLFSITDTRACVRMAGALSERLGTEQDDRQGCIMSQWLLNVFMDKCVRDACENAVDAQMNNVNVRVLLYADDAILMTENERDLQNAINNLNVATDRMDLSIDGKLLEKVNDFMYLGRMFCNNGRLDGEIDRQVNASQRIVGCMWTIAKNEVVLKETKMAVYKTKSNKYGYKRNGSLNQTSLYSIEFSQQNVEDAIEFEEENNQFPDRPLSPRPMTPRRVKRRSVISRGSTSRTSQHDKRGSGTYNNTMRHSHRSSYRRSNLQHQNPVTRLIEQQQNLDSSTTSNESANRLHYPGSSQADLITPTQQWKKSTGHTNPVYEQNSTQSLNDDDIYNNRPSSARSSYSNYHGTRPISGYRGPGNAYFMTSQATPQVPVSNVHKHNSHRNHAAFLCSGPPPYHVDGALLAPGCVCVTRALCGRRSQVWLLVVNACTLHGYLRPQWLSRPGHQKRKIDPNVIIPPTMGRRVRMPVATPRPVGQSVRRACWDEYAAANDCGVRFDLESNLNIPVISSLVHCESSALDVAITDSEEIFLQ